MDRAYRIAADTTRSCLKALGLKALGLKALARCRSISFHYGVKWSRVMGDVVLGKAMIRPNALIAMAALSHEHRFAVYRMLVDGSPDGAAAGVIAATIGIAPSSLTFHLQHLQRAGLVLQRRVGRNLIYTANLAASRALVDYLVATCCGDADAAPSSTRSNGSGTGLSL